MNPYVKSIQFRDDYCLFLTFENGEKRIFDLKPYFNKPVFARLRNAAVFKTAHVVSGSVEWQGEIDLSYDTLYLESKAVKAVRSKKKNLALAAVQKKKLPKVHVAVK